MNKKLKIVLDTNIFFSSLFGGNPKKIVDIAFAKQFDLLISEPILIEINRIMAKGLKDDTLQYFLNAIITNSTKINPSIHFEAIPEDPSDNIFLDCAVEGKADFIISGNTKHLGKLKSFQSIPILTPRQFLDQFHA